MKNCLLTGSSGFLGSILYDHLNKSFRVLTLGRSFNSDIRCDISENIPNVAGDFQLVVHAAGKAHSIPKTESEKNQFHKTNYLGTINLFRGLEKKLKSGSKVVFISTVAVYGLDEGLEIEESYPLIGNTPYALSKINAERWLTSFCAERALDLIILRLPLVIGANAPGNLGGMIKGISNGKYATIGKASARKSMVLASDVGVLIASNKLVGGVYNLTDGHHPSLNELEKVVTKTLGKKITLKIPYFAAKLIATVGDFLWESFPLKTHILTKLTKDLTFSDEKARKKLAWQPSQVLETTDWIS